MADDAAWTRLLGGTLAAASCPEVSGLTRASRRGPRNGWQNASQSGCAANGWAKQQGAHLFPSSERPLAASLGVRALHPLTALRVETGLYDGLDGTSQLSSPVRKDEGVVGEPASEPGRGQDRVGGYLDDLGSDIYARGVPLGRAVERFRRHRQNVSRLRPLARSVCDRARAISPIPARGTGRARCC